MRISDWSSDVCSSIFAEAGSLHDGVKAGEQRAGAIVDDAGQELDNLDAGLSDRTVTNARRGCPPLRERLPLVELCCFDHLPHLASIADRRVGLRPTPVAYVDPAGPLLAPRMFSPSTPVAVDAALPRPKDHRTRGMGINE